MKMDYEAMLEELAQRRPDLKEDIMSLQEQIAEDDIGDDINAEPEDEEDMMSEEPVMPGRPDKSKRIPKELMDEEEEEVDAEAIPAMIIKKRPRGK